MYLYNFATKKASVYTQSFGCICMKSEMIGTYLLRMWNDVGRVVHINSAPFVNIFNSYLL